MSMSYSKVQCPLCAHETPRPAGRDFVVCTCGLRLFCGTSGPRRHSRELLFGGLALVAMAGAALDLFRRFW